MLSKLDILCLDRKRDSRRASFLIKDILEEGDEEEDIVVTEDEEYSPSQLDRRPPSTHHVTQVPTSLISLPQGTLWDPHLGVTYPVGAMGPSHVISNEEHAALLTGRGPTHQRSTVCAGGLSFCCLNCPPQSWHSGFTELLAGGRADVAPAPIPASVAAAAGVCVGLVPSAGVPVLGPAGGATASTAVSWSSCLGIARQDRTVDGLVQVGSKEGGSKSSNSGGGPPRKVRRNRTVFTELQLMGLERRFDCQKYLSTPDRAELARALGLTQLQVKTWYQNRRMKWKKQVMQGGCTVPPTKPKGRPKKNSIPSLNETQSRTCNAELTSLKDAF